MLHARSTVKIAVMTLVASTASMLWIPSHAVAQPQGSQPVHFRVSGPAQRLEMIVNTSRILTLDFNAPRLLVNNPNVVSATPLAPNQIQVSARTPGITEINIWDENNNVHSIDVLIYGDARELQNTLNHLFKDARVEVRPSNGTSRGSVILSGYVPKADDVSRIVTIAQDFYPNVINNMTVGGVQTVLLHVKVLEVSRTKMRALGIDWAVLFSGDRIISNVNGLVDTAALAASNGRVGGGGTVQFALFDGNNQFGSFIAALRQNNLAKLLAEPTLVTVSGRPASFNSGGQIPVPVSAGLGVTSVEYREFGTTIDFVPIVLGNGKVRLEVRPEITEIANDLADAVTGTPGLRSRRVDTGVEMRAGQTLALAGLIQRRTEAENTGIPLLSDIPWAGAFFRRVEETVNEIELLILVTPQFVDAMDPHEVPSCGPGEFTTSPSDAELYGRGYIEVPKCCNEGDFSSVQGVSYPSSGMMPGVSPEVLPSGGASISNPVNNGNAAPAESGASYRGMPQRSINASYQQRPAAAQQYGQPAATPSRYNPYDRAPARQAAPSTSRGAEPTLIGPIGYDVLK
ncbi:MAG: pilus assembly protein N-terminal domain-containing protein [Pirellulaceae bacterium]